MGVQGVVGGSVAGFVPGAQMPDDIAEMAYTLLGEPDEVYDELRRINEKMHGWYAKEPDQVLMEIAAYTPRLTELSRLLFQREVADRRYQRIRTMHVQPLLEECDRQNKIHSRLLEARRQDLAIAGIMR